MRHRLPPEDARCGRAHDGDSPQGTLIRRWLQRWTREHDTLIAEATRLLSPFEPTLTAAGGAFLFGAAPVYADSLLYGILGNFTCENAAPFPPELPALRAWNERLRGLRY